MSNVQLAIGGRSFTVACADGEERHIAELGRVVEAVVNAGNLRNQSEARMLLFAALMLADELHEAREALAAHAAAEQGTSAALEQRVEHIAQRIEALAGKLDHAAS